MEMLAKTEAMQFLVDILELNNIEEILNYDDKVNAVEAIMDAYREKEPFQNISLMSVDFDKRSRPSWTEIKNAIFLKQGGLCYSHHIFLFALFKALGFHVSLGTGGVTGPNNHVVLFFKDVCIQGDVYLLEAAIGLPSFHLISLDFEHESPVYRDSFLEYKYIKHGGKILRMHRKGDPRPNFVKERDINVDGWTRFYDFEIADTQNIEDFNDDYDAVYTDPQITHFHSSFHFIIFINRKAFIAHNTNILTENDENELEKIESETNEEIIRFMRNLTSSIDESTIRLALGNYKDTKRRVTSKN
ncbi:hypothetical protein LOTGIDRAFT_237354 [Lottia gigantea]|uniref:arylamine N-acetyltransferase n=1 Tax=Lottia gigantea TaxID=225164 RepID=V4B2Y7_LOTGI|nr:hypothetical protein LOTGIDRAFT_237354 [Lottia gigantea]ESP04523.1 hypothetical protein LOTGIDRAFT_237354 [Lottia gigantea]